MKRFRIIALLMAAVIAFSVFSVVTLADGEPSKSTLEEITISEKKKNDSQRPVIPDKFGDGETGGNAGDDDSSNAGGNTGGSGTGGNAGDDDSSNAGGNTGGSGTGGNAGDDDSSNAGGNTGGSETGGNASDDDSSNAGGNTGGSGTGGNAGDDGSSNAGGNTGGSETGGNAGDDDSSNAGGNTGGSGTGGNAGDDDSSNTGGNTGGSETGGNTGNGESSNDKKTSSATKHTNDKPTPTPTPAPTSEPPETYETHTLSFAYHHVGEEDGVKYLYLSQEKIQQYFDDQGFEDIAPIKIYSDVGATKTEINVVDALFSLPLDGVKKYVCIEDEHGRGIWGGTFEAKAYELESGQYACNIPHQLAYYIEEEVKIPDNESFTAEKVSLNLNEIIEEYGDVTVKVVHHALSSENYKPVSADGDVYTYQTDEDNGAYYFRIWNKDMTFMWAGLIKAPTKGNNKTLTFKLFKGKGEIPTLGDDNEFEYESPLFDIISINDTEITLKFVDTPNYDAETKFAIEWLNEKGEIVWQEFVECDLSKLKDKKYTIKYEGGVSYDAVALKCALLVADSEVYADVYTDVDKIGKIELQTEPDVIMVTNLVVSEQPVETIDVQIEGYSGVYDGEAHTAVVFNPEELEGVAIEYAEKPEDGSEPKWQEEKLTFTDAGEHTLLIRAEKEGCGFTYIYNGETVKDDYAEVQISIEPKAVTVTYQAKQESENIYTGKEQTIEYHYEVSDIETTVEVSDNENDENNQNADTDDQSLGEPENADSALLDGLKGEINLWLKEKGQSIKETDAGEHSVPEIQESFENSNYEITWKLDDNSKVTIEKATITFSLPEEYTLYGTDIAFLNDTPKISVPDGLSGDAKSDAVADNDYGYSIDSNDAGVYSDIIWVSVGVTRNSNLEVIKEDKFIIFPQSINRDDDKIDYANIDISGYKEDSTLPGFYNDIQIELSDNGVTYDADHDHYEVAYDGKSHAPSVVFKDKCGNSLNLEENKDYTVKYSFDGSPVEDCTKPGKYTVEINGINNYSGTVTRTFEITFDTGFERIPDSFTAIIYAGSESNNSDEVLLRANSGIDPTEYEWKDSEGKLCETPSDAGEYYVQAIWKNDNEEEIARSEWYHVEIKAAKVTIQVSLDENQKYVYTVVSDQTSHFGEQTGSFILNENLIEIVDGEFSYVDSPNYEVIFQPTDDVKRKLEEDGVTLTLNGWVYGGDANEPVIAGIDADYKYTYYNSDGDKLGEKPTDAGKYTVTATWIIESNVECEKTAEFTIKPKEITISVDDCEKTYGGSDPNWKFAISGLSEDEINLEQGKDVSEYTIQLAEGGEIKFAVERKSGEDVGEYTISVKGTEVQGNYSVKFDKGTLEITPKSIEGFNASVIEGKPTLKDENGNELEAGTDYEFDSSSFTFTGTGDYDGKLSTSNTTLSIVDGLTLTVEDTISTDMKGAVSFEGSFTLNELPPESDSLKVIFNGSDEIEPERVGATTEYRFSVKQDLTAERPDNIEVAITYEGNSLISKTLGVRYKDQLVLWSCAAIIMTVGAIISGIACARLNKRLKRERYKLLDENSRRSSRTIREQD